MYKRKRFDRRKSVKLREYLVFILTVIAVFITIILGLEVNKTIIGWQNNQSVEQAISNKEIK
jgi:hypothetical protein